MNLVKTIYLTRHGETEYNEKHLLQGVIDISLSEKGVREAELLSERLKQETIDAIFLSPLTRAKQTSEIINRNHQAKLHVVDCLIEMAMGDWEGLEYYKTIEANPDIYQQWITDPNASIPGGESFGQVYERVKPGVDKVLASRHKNILIVAHAMVNRAILGQLLNLEPLIARKFRTDNCSLSRVLVFKTPANHRHIVVDAWNCIAHLRT